MLTPLQDKFIRLADAENVSPSASSPTSNDLDDSTIPQSDPNVQQILESFLHTIQTQLSHQGINTNSPDGKAAMQKEIINTILKA